MSRYVLQQIEDGLDIKRLMDMVMSTPKERRPRIGGKLVYASMYRPIDWYGAKTLVKEEGVETWEIDNGTRGLVTTTEPLSPEAIERWELTPVGKAAAWALLSVTKLPIELAEVSPRGGHVRGVLIHEGTKREPRMTFFEEEVGAKGHQEGTFEELTHEALSMGYRRLSPGLIDDIVATTVSR
jgi:hypothetical protein